MNHSTPGLPVHHQLPESTQTHVHRVSGAIQPAHPPVVPFSSCPQSFPASGSFPISQPFASGGQSIGVSASASVLPMNTQDPSPLGWTDWISLKSKGLSRVFSNTTVQSINSLALSFLYSPTLTSIHDTGKTIALTRQTFVGKVMSLLFNMLSRLVITFGPNTSWQIDGETVETVSDFILGAPKSLQMVIAAMKLKDAYFLERKL